MGLLPPVVGTLLAENAEWKTKIAESKDKLIELRGESEKSNKLRISIDEAQAKVMTLQADIKEARLQGEVPAELKVSTAEASAKVMRLKAQMATLKVEEEETAAAGSGGFSKFAGLLGTGVVGAAAIAGAAVIAVGAVSVDMAAKFQDSLATMAGQAQITTAQATAIGNAFLTTAGQSTFSAQQMVAAYGPVAGQLAEVQGHTLSAADAMSFMHDATEAAEATGTDLTATTHTLSGALQAFQINTGDASIATNTLFNMARLTGGTFDDTANSLEKARAKMGALAPSLTDLSGLMLDLTNHGETGRAAMSAVGSMFNGLISPTKAVTKAQQDMGVTFETAQGNMKPMSDIIGELQPKLAGMGDAQAIAELKALGFSGASQKLLDIIRGGPNAFNAATTAVQTHDAVSQAAAQHSQTLEGAMHRVGAEMSDAGVKIGQKLMPFINDVANGLAVVLPGAIDITLKIFSTLGDVITNVSGFLIKASKDVIAGWQKVAPTVTAVFNVIKTVVVTAVGVVVNVIKTTVNVIRTVWGPLTTVLSVVFQVAFTVISTIIGTIVNVIKVAVSVITTIWNVVTTVLSVPIQIAVSLISTYINVVITVVSAVISVVTKIWGAAIGALSGPVKTAVGIIGTIFGTIGGIVHGVVDTISKVFGTIGDIVRNIFQGVSDTIGGIIKGIVNIVRGIIDVPINVVNGIIDAIDGIKITVPGWVPGIGGKGWDGLNISHIPQLALGGPTMPYGTYMVGEQGPEILQMGGAGGFVYPNKMLNNFQAKGGSAGGTNYTVDARIINPVFNGTPQQMLHDMQSMINQNNREISLSMRQLLGTA